MSAHSVGRAREARGQAWITNTGQTAAIQVARVPDGIRLDATSTPITLTLDQAHLLCAQIRTESRKKL